MQWQFLVALVVAIPVILFPVALVWYPTIGGIFTAIREKQREKVTEEAEV